jgi:DtxR family Mn-dependent transcriptional regulator
MTKKKARSARARVSETVDLSTAHEDYLETIHQLEAESDNVRISDIAERLGVRLPPVTRAVQALQRRGYVQHENRRRVGLTEEGRKLAQALTHRHADLVSLLTDVLAVPPDIAEADTCQMEHGISPHTAQRLHEFLEHFNKLDEATRALLRPQRASAAFRFLPVGRGAGWRA